ncbi:hypothetical protein [Thermococcus barophilus]|uniref:Uncharacterized protein n=1 Tax=Thermococcus barophilus (strain DSM 11836 / MP) TaxID=391623 RepID=F0LJM4_THEBM|nr:hypothetical protein [Thermococcus barophilus]ADT84666.1 hypothetical protein TERMP_01691 [Thermococcus barophilus MP]
MDIFQVLAYVLIIPFVLLNVMISMMRFFISAGSKLMTKIFRIQIPKNEKREYEILFTITWIVAGIYALKSFKNTNILLGILIFLTFRNGAAISKKLIYGIHDANLIKENAEDKKILGLINRAVGLGILSEILFLFIWALSYRAITIGMNALLRLGLNELVLYLWIAGVVFGAVFGMFISHNNKGILLQNEVMLVLLFAGKKGFRTFMSLKQGTKQNF